MLPACRDIESWGYLHKTPAIRWLRKEPGKPVYSCCLHAKVFFANTETLNNNTATSVRPFPSTEHVDKREVVIHFRAAIGWRSGCYCMSICRPLDYLLQAFFEASRQIPLRHTSSLRNPPTFQNAPAGAPEPNGVVAFVASRRGVGDMSFVSLNHDSKLTHLTQSAHCEGTDSRPVFPTFTSLWCRTEVRNFFNIHSFQRITTPKHSFTGE
jgi:hypothetical protein